MTEITISVLLVEQVGWAGPVNVRTNHGAESQPLTDVARWLVS